MTSPISGCGKFRGVEFFLRDLPVVRALARGITFTLRNGGFATEECLERIARAGFATKVETAQKDANGYKRITTYRANDDLLTLDKTPVISFDTMAANMGRSLDKPAQRKWRVKVRDKSKAPRTFPSLFEVQYQARAAKKRSAMFEDVFTKQYPVESTDDVINYGDEYQFSSPGLTTWYVQQFCSLNNLKV